MVGGRGVRLDEWSAVGDAELFVCVELQELGQTEALVRSASAIDRDWLPAAGLRVATEVEFDAERQRVVVRSPRPLARPVARRFGDQRSRRLRRVDTVGRRGGSSLRSGHLAGRRCTALAVRVQSLRGWMPELDLPEWNDERLRELLPLVCAGCKSLEEARRRPLVPVLKGQLSAEQLAAVDREVPERLRVPSGSQIALRYEPGKPPVLAVRIQEIFGLSATPRIAAGRVPLLLHLLAPNMRPQQITDDLASFWDRTYAEVRKELRRRYPKHAWPEDPRAAPPQKRPGRERGPDAS